MVVRGTRLDTAQMASLVVTVASQIAKRSVSSEGPNNIEFVEVSYQLTTLSLYLNHSTGCFVRS